jgi:hypothetical protein
MYSSASHIRGSTQPVPVVPNTASTRRPNAPVRSSSRTASSARSRGVGADPSPTYTRIGCTAGRPENVSSLRRSSALPVNVRPSRPSSDQATRDRGPPDSSGEAGGRTPGGVVSLATDDTLFTALTNPENSTSSTNTAITRATSSTPSVCPATRGTYRSRRSMSARPASRTSRASTSSTQNSTAASPTMATGYQVISVSMPMSARRSRCQP